MQVFEGPPFDRSAEVHDSLVLPLHVVKRVAIAECAPQLQGCGRLASAAWQAWACIQRLRINMRSDVLALVSRDSVSAGIAVASRVDSHGFAVGVSFQWPLRKRAGRRIACTLALLSQACSGTFSPAYTP